MERVKTFDATGNPPGGRLYAGDLNLIQDMAAGVGDVSGSSLGTLAARPDPGDVPDGTRYVTTDQVSEYMTSGGSWVRIDSGAGKITGTLKTTASPGCILLKGQAWPSTTGIYADLYALFGGANLPDFRGKAFAGKGTGGSIFNVDEGTTVGEEKHTLTVDEIPSHGHNQLYAEAEGTNFAAFRAGTNDNHNTGGTSMQNTGGGLGHNNVPPTVVGNWEVKL